jgi:hypothetical protein
MALLCQMNHQRRIFQSSLDRRNREGEDVDESNLEWNQLHDATLIDVVVEWRSGESRFTIRLSERACRTAEIKAQGLRMLHCPRLHPWGPSVSLNEVRHMNGDEGRQRVEIEMQSGDVIEIEAERFELKIRE